MRDAGYEEPMIVRTQGIVGKKDLKVNPETQCMEDTIGLVFLEHVMEDFVSQHPEYDEAKWVVIIRKTWAKMSDRAHEFVLSGNIRLPEAMKPLIMKALAPTS
jgi:hypothetical protein